MRKQKNNIVILLLLLILARGFSLYAQNTDANEDEIKQTIENSSALSDNADFDYNTLLEDLKQYAKNPINLNKADAIQLAELGLLSQVQIDNIFAYIDKYGKLISIYELQNIPSIDLLTIKKILPFVTVNSNLDDVHVKTKDLIFKGDYQLFVKYQQVIEKAKGYIKPEQGGSEKGYLGSPFKLYTRFRYNYGSKLSYGFTAEKDAGEQFFKGTQKTGFDFYSGHLYVRNVSVFKDIALGDYTLNMGQGLIMWTGFGFGKSPMVMNVRKQSRMVRPYTSVSEFNFLRGAAFTIGIKKNISITGFVSYKRVDANVTQYDSIQSQIFEISAIQLSGFHRTASEVADKNAIRQLVSGGAISYNKRKYHIGLNVVYTRLSAPLISSIKPYNQYDFRGKSLLNASLDYHVIVKNFHFFGEEAISQNGGYGFMNGVLVGLGPNVEMSAVHRYYARNFQTLFARPFAESTTPQNEHGTYVAISIKPKSYLKFDAYFDWFKFPWLKFLVDRPTSGYETFVQVSFIPSKKVLVYTRYRHVYKEVNLSGNTSYYNELVPRKQDNLRFHIDAKVTDALTLSTRAEFSFYKMAQQDMEHGYLLYQDISFKALSFPVEFSARFALFQTSSFNTRIYAYEDDVLYSFSIPAYQDRGMRYYLNARWSVYKGIDIWLRFSQTYINNQKTIGTGLDELPKGTKSEIKAQIRFKF
ncbi:MAG: helix-hairpin-helix domain-containing protein [Bacteroidota bacterium]